MRGSFLAAAAGLALLLAGPVRAADGVVVTRVAPGEAADKAGLLPGDVLLSWEQGEANAALGSPFDLEEAALEYAPRGPVRIRGQRGGVPLDVALFPDAWGIDSKPHGEDEAWRLAEVANNAAARSQVGEAAAAFERAVSAARGSSRPHAEAQLLARLGALHQVADGDASASAAAAYERALAVRRRMGPDGVATASLADPIGTTAHALGRGEEEPRKLLTALVQPLEQLAPDSLVLARTLLALGRLQRRRADAVAPFARAVALAERLAPESLLVARALTQSATVESDLPRREAILRRALGIQERLSPRSPETAVVLIRLASTLELAGEPARALELHERALAIVEQSAPGTDWHARVLSAVGGYWYTQGDLVQAEAYFRRALEIDERLRPGAEFIAVRLYNLAEVLRTRRDFEQAEAALVRALALSEALSPRGELAGRILHILGRTLQERGDHAAAETHLRKSIAILADAAPGQLNFARESLGAVLAATGRHAEARELYLQNLEAARKTTQSRYILADALQRLGDLALATGDLEAAEAPLEEALALRRRAVPETVWHAESAHARGVVERRRRRPREALALFEEAVRALEGQGRRLGGAEVTRAAFRAHYQKYYRDLEELLLELGRTVDAFVTMERSRARGLLALLASRDGLEGRLSPELATERRRADAEHDRLLHAAEAPGVDEVRRAALEAEIDRARLRQEEVRARIRAALPREAAMRDPEPLDLAGVRSALEPGTLLLSYSLGEETSRVYAVGPGPGDFAVLPVPATAGEVREAVLGFRETIAARRSVLRAAVATRSLALTRTLLAPAAPLVARAARILVVPDGALHVLPFAALRDPSRTRRHLVESVPVHSVSSMTVYAVLARRWREAGSGGVVAFGDPAYGAAAPADGAPALARVRRAGLRLDRLPASRREVEAVKALSPQARVWLDGEATEEQAVEAAPGARVLHFATHGFLDERLPLESGLALAVPVAGAARENGFLQAWEVFERLRLDADLVTLSACDSGLGKEMGAEGLLGLTWAFQYAGARTVLASLWEVSDESTADLMTVFYRHLAAGAPPVEALRRAQVSLLRRPSTSAPYHWAAFTLIGASR